MTGSGTPDAGGRPRADVADSHVPVMLERIVSLLRPAIEAQPAPVVIDATLGLGGHTRALLESFPDVRVIGIDRDPQAIQRATDRLASYGRRFVTAEAVYDEILDVLRDNDIDVVDAVLFDLGVSSMQLDRADRGFAYAQDAPLDMRMSQRDQLTAAQIVNTYSLEDLTRIFREYGEERFANRVAKAIVHEREREALDSTARLAELIRSSIPAATRRTGGHPAKRVFQALRIEVNAELEVLSRAIPAATSVLRVGGRIAVLSYQSLEDRIVKRHFAALAADTTPLDLPVQLADARPQLTLLARGEAPTDAEIASNPRAASARLRAAQRLRPAAGSAAEVTS